MKVSLNTEKCSFCQIGPFLFIPNSEDHEIDVNELSDEYKKQLLYDLRRGMLFSNDREGLSELNKSMQPVTPTPVEMKPVSNESVVKAVKESEDRIKENIQPLKNLLRQTVATVKKEAANFSVGKLRKLLELEKETKNRKSVVSFLAEKLEQHEKSVTKTVSNGDGKPVRIPDPFRRESTQVSDVVESEVVQVTFGQGDVKQTDDGLLLTQEVLNQTER